MKNYKQVFEQVIALAGSSSDELRALLWPLICYSPKIPLRLHQQQLLNEAISFNLSVPDPHFSRGDLKFNGFVWGTGTRKILLTHGWASKAADFFDFITVFNAMVDVQVIAFDAPGNGSGEGELSNLLLYVEAVKAVMQKYGAPDVLIGHSLGAMANVVAMSQTGNRPSLLISLAPLINLKENFKATLDFARVTPDAQDEFFKEFEALFNASAEHFNWNELYTLDNRLSHFIAYSEHDQIAPYEYLRSFLTAHPDIVVKQYDDVTHERILKNADVVADVAAMVNKTSTTPGFT